MMNRSVIIIGGGGHAKVLLDALLKSGIPVAGILDPDTSLHGNRLLGVQILGGDELLSDFPPQHYDLVNGVGSIKLPHARRMAFIKLKDSGYNFATVVHPSAIIGSEVELGEGSQIMAGTILQSGCRVGYNTIINTRSSLDHDCSIGSHCHIAPGATLSGGVKIGNGVHIGTGATVIQNISIGNDCLIAAGAVVVSDITEGLQVRGVPAQEFV